MKSSAIVSAPLSTPHLISRSGVALGLPLLFAVIVLLPQCLPNDWFYLDLPNLDAQLRSARFFALPNPSSGRHLPFYEAFYSAAQIIFGSEPRSYFIAQSAFMLAASTCLFFGLQQTDLASRYFPFFFLALFPSASAEIYATCGKHESILVPLYLIALGKLLITSSSVFFRRLLFALLLTLVANWTKETAPAIVALFFGYDVAILISDQNRKRLLKSFAFSIGSIGGTATAKTVSWFLSPEVETSATYVSYNITPELILQNIRAYAYACPALYALAILAAIAFVIAIIGRDRSRYFALGTASILSATIYAFGLLLWKWAQPYYVSIPEILYSFSIIFFLIATPNRSIPIRTLSLVTLATLSWITCVAGTNFYYHSEAQRSVARSYTFAIRAVAGKLEERRPIERKVILANFSSEHEAVHQTRRLLADRFCLAAAVQGIEVFPFNGTKNEAALDPASLRTGDLVLVLEPNFPGVPHQNLRSVSPTAISHELNEVLREPNYRIVAASHSAASLPCGTLRKGISFTRVTYGATVFEHLGATAKSNNATQQAPQ